MDTPQKRLEWFINEFYPSKTAFARVLGISLQGLVKYLGPKGMEYQSKKKDLELMEAHLNPEWYHTGKGDPWIGDQLANRHIIKDPATQYPLSLHRYSQSNVEPNASLPDRNYINFVQVIANSGDTYTFNITKLGDMKVAIDRQYDKATHIALKMAGELMLPEIPPMATIVVELNREASPHDIVLASIDNQLHCLRYKIIDGKAQLIPDNKKFPTIAMDASVTILGVVVEFYKQY